MPIRQYFRHVFRLQKANDRTLKKQDYDKKKLRYEISTFFIIQIIATPLARFGWSILHVPLATARTFATITPATRFAATAFYPRPHDHTDDEQGGKDAD
jgi:hypothetical protein